MRLPFTKQPVEKSVKTTKKIFEPLGGMIELGIRPLSGEKSISTKILMANRGWVYRNNDAIAQEVSKMEFELYTIGISAGEIVFNPVLEHPLLDLLDTIQSHKKLSGDAFWLKLRTNNVVTSLRHLPPDKVELNLKSPTEKDPTVIEGYLYKDTIDGKAIKIVYSPQDIIHIKKPNPNNEFRGLGAVEALSETIDLDNLTTETTRRFFMNGSITNFVLSTDSKVTDEQLKRLRAEMRSSYGGVNNAYKAMILGGGLKPVDISYTNKEMEMLGQLEWYRDKIMYGFGNTKASLGMVDDVNRASHEGSVTEWQRNTVRPDMEAIVDALNLYLVPEFGNNLVLGFCDPVPDDRTDDILEATNLFNAKIITKNEARELVGLEPVDGGDDFEEPEPVVIPQGGNNEDS